MNRFIPAPASIVTACALCLGAFQPSQAQNEAGVGLWTKNYETAIAEAKSAGKDLILVFTSNSDVKICQVLDRDILNQPAFTGPMSEKYTLVRLNFPREKMDQPINEKVQNDLLKRAYRISGFPTVIATDTEGRPFGMNGYQPVKPDEYAATMLSMRETKKRRDEKFAVAKAVGGLEKAKLLAEGIPVLPGNLMGRYYRPQMEALVENDPNNETGVVEKYSRILADVTYSQQMEVLGNDVQWGKMVKLTDRYIIDNKLESVEKQRALMNKFGVQRRQKDIANSIATLIEVVKIDPKSASGKQAAKVLENLRAQKLQEDLLK